MIITTLNYLFWGTQLIALVLQLLLKLFVYTHTATCLVFIYWSFVFATCRFNIKSVKDSILKHHLSEQIAAKNCVCDYNILQWNPLYWTLKSSLLLQLCVNERIHDLINLSVIGVNMWRASLVQQALCSKPCAASLVHARHISRPKTEDRAQDIEVWVFEEFADISVVLQPSPSAKMAWHNLSEHKWVSH